MSDAIKHECGIAMIRLRKPLEYYVGKYGTALYGINKLQLLMEKQHNRGQDGAGMACVKLDMPPGTRYINRTRSNAANPIKDLFNNTFRQFEQIQDENPKRLLDVNWMKDNAEFTGELFLGHLRYGTFGKNEIRNLHPVMRVNNWKTRNLVLAGNFNLTNVDELFTRLVSYGQYPVETSDTVTMLEKIGHFLDEENEELYARFKKQGLQKSEITDKIIANLDLQNILENSSKYWDGGYAIAGLLGHGDAFVMRDPSGIRPAFYYMDDEVVVAASERPVIQTTFNLKSDQVKELAPGDALIIKKDGQISLTPYAPPKPRKACSFERIYFSRGTDRDIYNERKALGIKLTPAILDAVDHDIENTVFSYIPNTAAVAFYGLMEGLNSHCDKVNAERIAALGENISLEKINEILHFRPRMEKVAVKDIKLRTFITEDQSRDDLVTHVYDITYGSVRPGVDNLVVLDDSIVRGTTLKKSIIRILDRLEPKQIIVASSAPQIRYPDCYGIDMAKMGDFIAFNAAIALLKERNMVDVINRVYAKSKAQENLPKEEIINYVKEIYEPFTPQEISDKISELLTPKGIKSKVKILYQLTEDLHLCCPDHTGDWYFTGDYPTPGGNRVVNKSFINYIEGKNERAY
ncbi:MAG: amidophosphoribosyltransferase [Marinilabiliales bacterium]|nr:MAG: amidophosphoribosyltransferase [Marinilabiliales bacterium]